jgi:hypothetical protein
MDSPIAIIDAFSSMRLVAYTSDRFQSTLQFYKSLGFKVHRQQDDPPEIWLHLFGLRELTIRLVLSSEPPLLSEQENATSREMDGIFLVSRNVEVRCAYMD